MTHTYSIKGMTCGSCVARVKSELLKLGDVQTADVQLTSPQATIVMGKHIGIQQLQTAISKAGNYTIAEDETRLGHLQQESMETTGASSVSYLPIVLIFSYITIVTLLVQFSNGAFNFLQWTHHFMAGFFLVFSFFKLINLKGFAEGYATYDVVAKKIPVWGFIYPFVELALGLSFLIGLFPWGTNVVTLIVMAVSSIGVIQSLAKGTKIQCACLGTVIKLPLSKVTLFEDLLMVAMCLVVLIIY